MVWGVGDYTCARKVRERESAKVGVRLNEHIISALPSGTAHHDWHYTILLEGKLIRKNQAGGFSFTE